ncbi:hypothetical protein L2E82_03855 [Cichorium intybus]|uniref:Uncharacterized protein n=1 Tax=Cichorium intybus TaxID=13427 RepID=A0ACB9H4I3_CICIN|nr:hypothetical protein L2E82_03855 [Cichorium intybus]
MKAVVARDPNRIDRFCKGMEAERLVMAASGDGFWIRGNRRWNRGIGVVLSELEGVDRNLDGLGGGNPKRRRR